MKKVYMNPEGKVVSLRVNENISSSSGKISNTSGEFGIKYTIEGDKVFIYTSNHEACELGDEAYNRFFDLVVTYVYGIDPNCRFEPGADE